MLEQVVKIVRCYSCNMTPKGKECALFDKCSQYAEVQSILALIASEQKPMVEALRRAANEAYQNEIIDTEMKHISIGHGKEWETKSDWIQDKLVSWGIDAVLEGK